MPFIIGIIGIIAAAYFWTMRARNAAEMAKTVAEVPGDIMAAARRFGFKRRMNVHPVESVDDPNLAIAGIANSFFELGALPTEEQRRMLYLQVQSVLRVSSDEAEELLVLGRWLASESGGPEAGILRLSRRLNKIAGADGFQTLMELIKNLLKDDWSEAQHAALHDVKRAFRL